LTDKKVDNKIAMTGETDLSKNVKAIGGLLAKLNGAKKAGATRALIPKENEEDWEDICRRGLDMTDENFKVIMVETIDEVLKLALIY
jgi:Lon-like ATP-dependent protease